MLFPVAEHALTGEPMGAVMPAPCPQSCPLGTDYQSGCADRNVGRQGFRFQPQEHGFSGLSGY